MEITVKSIDESNWEECIRLEVGEEQKAFISSNLHAIAESGFQTGMEILGIYRDDVMVGFASYVLDQEGDMNLYKLMIDKSYQGKGYGKKALALLMDILKKKTEKKEIWLGVHPGNSVAIKLYRDYGFVRAWTGLESDDEIFFKYDTGD